MSDLKITVRGLDKLAAAFKRFPDTIRRNIAQAGGEAAHRVILPTEGLKRYPPAGPGNAPPYPYYIRGRGTQVSAGRNLYNSERLGTQFYVEHRLRGTGFVTEIGNRASYARYVVGENQARHMAPIGWRRLIDVAREKLSEIQKVYQAWVDKTITELGLK